MNGTGGDLQFERTPEASTIDDAGAEVSGRVNATWLLLPLVIVSLTALAGYWLLHLAHSDAMLPGLFSTQEMTWFYWGQDRLANVVPLLASPVQDLRWNLALQFLLIGVGWFTLIALFAAHQQCRRGRDVEPMRVIIVVFVSSAINLVMLQPNTRWVFIFEQLYAFSTVLLLAGLIALTRDRIWVRLAGCGVVIVAMMVNPSLLLMAPVVFVLPQRPETLVRRSALAAAAMTVAFMLTSLASRLFSSGSVSEARYSDFSLRRSLDHLDTLFDRITGSMHLTGALAVAAVAVVIVVLRWRRFDGRQQVALGGAAAFAGGWTLLFAGNAWVAANGFYERYFFPVFATMHLLITVAVSEAIDAISERASERAPEGADVPTPRVSLPSRQSAIAAAAALILSASALTVWRFTRLSVDALTAARPTVEAARNADARFVVGDYWTAWPVVILGRMDGDDLEGIAYRFDPRRDDVMAGIEAALDDDATFRVACTYQDVQSCIDYLQLLTTMSLEVVEVVSESPIVLSVRPSQP